MAKTKKKLVPTPKVEVEETKEAEMGITPKVEPKVEPKIETKEEKVPEPLSDKEVKELEEEEIYIVKNKFNQFVREYTPEIHGDKRKALAEEFANKIKGKVFIK